jgi:hypothetical protein
MKVKKRQNFKTLRHNNFKITYGKLCPFPLRQRSTDCNSFKQQPHQRFPKSHYAATQNRFAFQEEVRIPYPHQAPRAQVKQIPIIYGWP